MKVLVTGADGMLGSHIVLELIKRNHVVSVFVLPNQSMLFPELQLNRIQGNILDIEGIKKAAQGHDAIIHAAALTDVWPYRSATIRKVNIDGTKNVVEASKISEIQRLVVIGSASSCGIGSKENPGTETTSFISNKYGLDYIDSKKAAQDHVIKEVKENNVPAIIINPTFMFGAYDSKPGAGKMILAIKQGKVLGYPPGGKNYVAAKDVAVAVVNALTLGNVGECYIVGNLNLTFKEAFEKIASVLEVEPPKRAIPKWLNLTVGWMSEKLALITRTIPIISYRTVRIGCDDHYFSNKKAKKELNLPSTDLETAIKECAEWMEKNGIK